MEWSGVEWSGEESGEESGVALEWSGQCILKRNTHSSLLRLLCSSAILASSNRSRLEHNQS